MKKLLAFIVLASLLVCCIVTASADESWTAVIEGNYSISEDGVITVVNPGYHPDGNIGPEVKGGPINCFLYNGFEATGAYTVSVKMTGTNDLPNAGDYKEGIIPWYVDDDNYLVVYAHWADYDRPTDLRCLQITGRINGQDVNRFDSAAFEYLPGNGWNDFWCDGVHVPQSDTYTLTVDVVPYEEYTSVLFIFGNDEDPAIKSGEIWVQNSDNLSVPGRVGVYAMGDTVTFTDFKVEPIVEEPEPTEPEPTEPEATEPQETKPAPTEPQGGQEAPQDAPVGLIAGIVAAVAVAAAVVIILVKKKK